MSHFTGGKGSTERLGSPWLPRRGCLLGASKVAEECAPFSAWGMDLQQVKGLGGEAELAGDQGMDPEGEGARWGGGTPLGVELGRRLGPDRGLEYLSPSCLQHYQDKLVLRPGLIRTPKCKPSR